MVTMHVWNVVKKKMDAVWKQTQLNVITASVSNIENTIMRYDQYIDKQFSWKLKKNIAVRY